MATNSDVDVVPADGAHSIVLDGPPDQPCTACKGTGVQPDLSWDFTKTGMNFLPSSDQIGGRIVTRSEREHPLGKA